MVELWLPYPPSVNSLYKRSRSGQVFKSPEARAFIQQVQYLYGWRMPQSGDIEVSIDLYRPRKTGDIDNIAKVLLDSLQGIAYHNDKQICELHIRRFDDRKNHPKGAARVTISQSMKPDYMVKRAGILRVREYNKDACKRLQTSLITG